MRTLSAAALESRLYELDAQFRRDMATLTEKYDAARTAVENAIAEHGGDAGAGEA
jgi:hypothetical protein